MSPPHESPCSALDAAPNKYTGAECSVEPVKADMLRLQQSEGARPPKARSKMQLVVVPLIKLVRHTAALSVLAPQRRLCANSGERHYWKIQARQQSYLVESKCGLADDRSAHHRSCHNVDWT